MVQSVCSNVVTLSLNQCIFLIQGTGIPALSNATVSNSIINICHLEHQKYIFTVLYYVHYVYLIGLLFCC
jgi:hypothetical protein